MLNPLSFWQHWPSLNATQVGQPNVGAGGRGDAEGEGEDKDDELENVLGEAEPQKVTESVVACVVECNAVSSFTPLLAARDVVILVFLDGEYLKGGVPFSPFSFDVAPRKICSKSVCCIKANCSAAFKILDVMITSISGCNKI